MKEIELLKYNERLLFKLDLAFESYEDNTNNHIPLLMEVTKELNKFRKEKDNMQLNMQLELSKYLIEKYNKVLDIVGRENFIFYDDGDVNYIWKDKGENNE